MSGWSVTQPILTASIARCVFERCGGGLKTTVVGENSSSIADRYDIAQAYLTLKNNSFRGMTNAAVQFYSGPRTAAAAVNASNNIIDGAHDGILLSADPATSSGSTADLRNNLFTNVVRGIQHVGRFSVVIKNTVCAGCSYAIDGSSSSGQATYKCFWDHQKDFVGYNANYGAIVMSNNNGTPSDFAFNIFQNPMLLGASDYHLSASSPCIDAGDPAGAYLEGNCIPPARGTQTNDIGAYGGPGACDWHEGFAPTIVREPQSLSSCIGKAVEFSVLANGSQPLSYQWHFGGEPLDGQTASNLLLTNVQAGQSGSYSVLVSNALGSATSAPAQLLVNDACVDLHMYAGLTIGGQQGSRYVLKYTTDLSNTNFGTWTSLATNTLGTTDWFYLDMDSPDSPKRFYGVKLLP